MTQLNFYLLVLFAVFVRSLASHSDCGSEIGTVVSVQVSDCADDDDRCVLHRNTNATVKLTFTLKENVESVKAVVYGVVMDVPVPFALPNPDGCVNCGLSCPLQSGGTYVYQTSLPVLKKYPRVTVDVKWELQNGAGVNIACVLIPAKIQ